jgi:hypothetical protein
MCLIFKAYCSIDRLVDYLCTSLVSLLASTFNLIKGCLTKLYEINKIKFYNFSLMLSIIKKNLKNALFHLKLSLYFLKFWKVVQQLLHSLYSTWKLILKSGNAITNGREPRSCLSLVFSSKLGGIAATLGSKCMVCMQPLLKLKTWPKARPVS